ncbi:hypothetical protein [Nocardioides immobilis]|uniref:hypothetical protein n=1 Tax=Nocardioides immobilis TaxID=2049295 RepID=UPI0011C3548B|nr:hypothetical protein [Nocardioides immobilis]
MTGRARRVGTLAGIAVVLAVLLLSHRFGRADPTGDYRPVLVPDGLALGCYPLPGGVTFDFGYQLRRDGDVEVDGEKRRVLFAQYDEMDEDEALAAIVDDFAEAGFVASERPAPPYDAVLRRPGDARADVVRAVVEPLPGVEDDTIVRGTFELDLPVAELASDAPDCDDPSSTKRWDEDS